MKNNVNKIIDGLQSEMEQKFDNLQCSISKLADELKSHLFLVHFSVCFSVKNE